MLQYNQQASASQSASAATGFLPSLQIRNEFNSYITTGQLEKVKELLAAYPELLNYENSERATAVHKAFIFRQAAIVTHLIDLRCNGGAQSRVLELNDQSYKALLIRKLMKIGYNSPTQNIEGCTILTGGVQII